MAKAIHWPKEFEAIVRSEDTTALCCAIRPGTLYYDNRYWVEGEVVDIRVNHEIIRKAVVVGEMKCGSINSLNASDFSAHKPGLQSVEAIVKHLSERYEQDFFPESAVSVVYYKNLPMA